MKRLLVVLCCFSLFGCSNDEENIQAWMAEQAKGMRGSVKPLPEIKPFPPVEYDVGARVPPFDTARIEPERQGGGGGLQPDLNRRREPLEAYPLESLKMVGVLIQGSEVRALIKADQNIHQVKTGNYMGQDFGVVTQIAESEVTLKELVEDVNGDWVERTSSLMLQEQQGAAR